MAADYALRIAQFDRYVRFLGLRGTLVVNIWQDELIQYA